MAYRFTNWHQHSGYSWLDGASLPKDIVARCKELGMEYVCLSDHGNVAGHIDMYDAAKEVGMIPVLGSELYMKDDRYDNGKVKGFHVCLWALNEEGLHNLWAISSNTYYATGDGHRTPNARWEHFEGLGGGIACTSACLASALAKAAEADDEEMALYFAERYSSVFDEFAIELHTNSMLEQHKANMWLYDFAKKHGYRVVYSVDSHYAVKDDADFHDMWLGCQTKAYYDEKHWTMDHEYYIQGEDEVRDRLSYLGDDAVDDCFRGVDELLSLVEPIELDGSHKVPKFELPDGWNDAASYMKYLAAVGLLEKVCGCEVLPLREGDPVELIRFRGSPKVDPRPYLKQLAEDELPIVVDNGLSDYFLITSDYCRYAKEHMLVGPGRGSCVGSVLCYLLGITEIDPIGKGLYFSRFLNEGRLGSLPDIDSDFQDSHKHLVHEYLIDKYGEDKVTAVGVTTFFGMKLALKEVCRYYRIPIADANKMTAIFDDLEEIGGDDWHDALPLLKSDDRLFVEGYEKQYPDMFARAERMVGLPRQAGKHAAGYVISPEPLAKMMPVRKSSSDEVISQFDKVAVERMGFLKADVLGLRTLTTLKMAADAVEEWTGEVIDYYRLVDDPSDTGVWSLFDNGRTLGVFQMEGAGIAGVAMKLRPRSIMDLSTIVALYRPGVIGAGMLDKYIARSIGEEDVEYVTPLLEPILKDTLGVIVFQEQAMAIFSELAGFTPTEADGIRAAIGKKKMGKIRAARSKFVEGCEAHGISEEQAAEIFRQIEASGNYSFNKSHSLAYATIAFWTAYMKAHHPVEYYAACMSTVGMDKAPKFIKEARRFGVSTVPPVVSAPSLDYKVLSDSEISFGLSGVKGVGFKAAESIVGNAPYSSFEDFVDRSGVNGSIVKTLVKCGFFRSMYANSRDLLMRYEGGEFRATLFGEGLSESNRFSTDYEHVPYPDERVIEIETELMGMPLTIDPFGRYRSMLGGMYDSVTTVEDMGLAGYDTFHSFLVKVSRVKTHVTKNGDMMAFMSFEDDVGESFEAVCFPDVFSLAKPILREGRYAMVEVVKKKWSGRDSFQVMKVKKLDV